MSEKVGFIHCLGLRTCVWINGRSRSNLDPHAIFVILYVALSTVLGRRGKIYGVHKTK